MGGKTKIVIDAADGGKPFKVGVHGESSLVTRDVHISDLKEAINTGKVVYEREGVSKIVGDNIHVIFENETRRVYTIYRPYKFDKNGDIVVQNEGDKLSGVTINTREGSRAFYLSNHTRKVMEEDRGIPLHQLEYAIKIGDIRYERPGVSRLWSPRVELIFCNKTRRIYTVQRPYIYDKDGKIIGKAT